MVAQDSSEVQVIAVEDLTYSSDCVITRNELDPTGEIILSTEYEACPPGTNLHTFPTTEAKAIASGLPYVYFTGDYDVDAVAVGNLQASMMPLADIPQHASEAMVACPYRRYSASGSYAANSAGSRAYFSVDYGQDESCYGRIYSATQSFSASPTLYWYHSVYDYPVSPPGAVYGSNCKAFGTATITYYDGSGFYGWKVNLGGWYTVKSLDLSGCSFWGNTFTGSVRL